MSGSDRNLANTMTRVVANDYRINHDFVCELFAGGSRVFVFNYESVNTAVKSWPYSSSGLIGIKSGTWEGMSSLVEQIRTIHPRCELEVNRAQLNGNVLIVATIADNNATAQIHTVMCLEHRLPGVFVITDDV